MPRIRSNKGNNLLREIPQQHNRSKDNKNSDHSSREHEIGHINNLVDGTAGLESLTGNENCKVQTSKTVEESSVDAATLHLELDSFRLRWKRELEDTKFQPSQSTDSCQENKEVCTFEEKISQPEPSELTYAKAKKLFLTAVELEQSDMHFESIRYYKQAMHLCPDIEKRIFSEQCEASIKSSKDLYVIESSAKEKVRDQEEVDLVHRIRQVCHDSADNGNPVYCRPHFKPKSDVFHFSDLPHELMVQIFRYIIGEELDLASLESVGLVCRGFYLLSRDPSLWRSICYSSWGSSALNYVLKDGTGGDEKQVDWRKMFLERPRVNYDGIYISRTRYVRQGDTGFQDITYRPFHVVRYYRYLRFFPDRRVIILTTNEEPDKIVPIFRHVLYARQFSSELSILEGSFEFVDSNQIVIVAERDCRAKLTMSNNPRRQAQLDWSRQTPISQKFNFRFELKTVETKPYRNNVLKWLEYTILARYETSQETTSFDLSPETFPSLNFSRVRRFNLRLNRPLPSH